MPPLKLAALKKNRHNLTYFIPSLVAAESR
jgi:hypothetical protein